MKQSVATRAAVVVWLVLSVAAFGELDEEDFACENIAAKLEGCCPGFRADDLYCDYGGCGTPELSHDELDCLGDLSCSEIVERDICERLQERSSGVGTDAGTGPDPEEPLCG